MEPDTPDWDTIIADLLDQGRIDEVLTIAHMLAFERFCYDMMTQQSAPNGTDHPGPCVCECGIPAPYEGERRMR